MAQTQNESDQSLLTTLTFRRWVTWVGIFSLLAFLTFLICVGFGTEFIPPSTLLGILSEGLMSQFGDTQTMGTASVIVWQIRVPRVFLAFLVGGTLAAVGAALQALLRNPLADPYILGISSGAALGVALAILLGVGATVMMAPILPACAFLGALISLLIVYRVAVAYGRFNTHTLLLAGVILNAIFGALIMFLTTITEPTRAFSMMSWLMGTLMAPEPTTLFYLVAYVGVGLLLLGWQAHSLNILTLGEEVARSLGVEVERVKRIVFGASALLTGAVVAFSGLIGFVGMIVPHAVRMLLGADHRLLLPASGFVGGIFLMIADTVARTVFSPAEIPVGVVTALAGGPIFLYVLIVQQRKGV